MLKNKYHFVYHVFAVVIVTIWGFTFVNTKLLLQAGMSATEIFVVRFFLAYCCIWVISPRKLIADSLRDEFLLLLTGILGGSLYFIVENLAVEISYANNVAFIVCSSPLITVLLAICTLRNMRATWKLIAGSIIALIGVAVVIYNGHFLLDLNPLGDFLALAAAISWAIYSLLMRKLSNTYNVVFITRKVFFYGLITALPVFIVYPWQFPIEGFLKPVVWFNLLLLGLIASFACFVLWNLTIQKIGAVTTSNYIYLNPIATVAASALLLDEPITLVAVVGLAFILLGVYLANTEKGQI